jgi:hypothetical protein
MLFSQIKYHLPIIKYRFVLGVYPRDERSRLTEVLTKALTNQLACKGDDDLDFTIKLMQ